MPTGSEMDNVLLDSGQSTLSLSLLNHRTCWFFLLGCTASVSAHCVYSVFLITGGPMLHWLFVGLGTIKNNLIVNFSKINN